MQQLTNANDEATNEVEGNEVLPKEATKEEERSLLSHGPQTVTPLPPRSKDSAATSFRTDLTAMKKSALRARAADLGASSNALSEALDADDTKAAFIELIIAREADDRSHNVVVGDTVSVAGRVGIVNMTGDTWVSLSWMDDGTESRAINRGDLVLLAKFPSYIHCQQLVDEKKAKYLRRSIWQFALTSIITIISAGTLLYIGSTVASVKTCGRGEILSENGFTYFDNSTNHWKNWYLVAGFVTIFHGLVRISVLIMALPSDERVKRDVFRDTCRDMIIYKRFINTTAQVHDFYEAHFPGYNEMLANEMHGCHPETRRQPRVMDAMHCCIMITAVMFDFGWIIHGIVLYFQTKVKCTLMTKLFLYVVMYLFVMLITTFLCASKRSLEHFCAASDDFCSVSDNDGFGYEAVELKNPSEEGVTLNVVNASVDTNSSNN